MEPQFLPCVVQLVVTVQPPQTFATPPPAHDWGSAQVPHESVPPQPSASVPQFLACPAHVSGVQVPTPQTLAAPPPPHTCCEVQVPQLSRAPQPSGRLPQFFPSDAQVAGAQAQTFDALQVCGAWQLPHARISEQPSESWPQVFD